MSYSQKDCDQSPPNYNDCMLQGNLVGALIHLQEIFKLLASNFLSDTQDGTRDYNTVAWYHHILALPT